MLRARLENQSVLVSDPRSFSPVVSSIQTLAFASSALRFRLYFSAFPNDGATAEPRRAPTRRLDGWETRTDIVPLLRIPPRVPVVGHLDGWLNDDERQPNALRPMPR